MELHEIQKMPTTTNKIHESCFKSTHILKHVLKMVERGDSRQTIFEVVDLLLANQNSDERAKVQ